MDSSIYKAVEEAINEKDIGKLKFFIVDKEIGISCWGKVDLIVEMLKINRKEALNFIEEYINGDVDLLNLSYAQNVEIMLATKDKECIEKFLKKNSKNLNSKQNKYLIEATSDGIFIAKCINDNDINLEVQDRRSIIYHIIEKQDKDNIGSLIKGGVPKKIREIEIPEGMTIGIEIEVDGIRLRDELIGGWQAKEERSLPNGTEIVSPILKEQKKDSEDIYGICNLLKQAGGYTNQRCAAHVHIGAGYLTTKKSYANFLEIWCNSEELLYLISNQPGEVTRNEAYEDISFAAPISKKTQNAIETGDLYLSDEEDLKSFIKKMQEMQGETRYNSVNLLNIMKEGKNTIEFRLANGTIEPAIWIENINLFGGIIKAAEDLAKIQEKEEKNEEEKEKLEQLEKIKNKQIPEYERLEALLSLTVSEGQKEQYRSRYKKNSVEFSKKQEKRKKLLYEIEEATIRIPKKEAGSEILK